MKKYIFIILAAILFNTSCDSMLDLKPETDPSDASMWNKASAFEKEANNFYNFLPKFQDVKTGSDTYLQGLMDREEWSDIRMDNTTQNTTSNSTYTIVDEDKVYEEYFKNLRSINYLFRNASNYANPNEIKQYVAEAHFFRAYISSRVFANYGPLPIVKDVMETSSPELYGPRASRDDFANFIIEDLEAAINSGALPKQINIVATSTNGRIAIGAAQALLARVCLFEGTWQKYHFNNTSRADELLKKAVDNASKVIGDNSYNIFYNTVLGEESYKWMFILENVTKCNPAGVLKESNTEYVFRNRFHETVRQSGQNNAHRANGLMITRKMLEMFLDRDGKITKPDYKTSLNSYFKDRDPRIATLSNGIGDLRWSYENGSTFERDQNDYSKAGIREWNGCGFYVQKFAGQRPATNTADGYDVPIIRLAEVYLIYAEAKCELGSLTDNDLNISINKLRDRVHMPHLLTSTIPTGSTMLNEIRRERTCELYMEGHRYDDIRRWKTAEMEMSMAQEGVWMGSGSAFAKDHTFSYTTGQSPYTYLASQNGGFSMSTDSYTINEDASRRKFQSKHYLRPLPKKQLELNPQLEQNSGWEK